jgi:predicted enzyme related to lactoylglutathione lyase
MGMIVSFSGRKERKMKLPLLLTMLLLLIGSLSAAWAQEVSQPVSGQSTNKDGAMIQGLRTVVYPVTDMEKAKEWYTMVLGHGPYFDEPYYVGYAVGGFELGLLAQGEPGSQGAVAYWGVPDAEAALARLKKLGAEVHEEIQDHGVKVATVKDPFGNVFGIIENPHFKLEDVR